MDDRMTPVGIVDVSHDSARNALARIASNLSETAQGRWAAIKAIADEGFFITAQPSPMLRGFTKVLAYIGDKQPDKTDENRANAIHIAACDPENMGAIIALVTHLDEQRSALKKSTNLFKGKYRALLKLIIRLREQLVEIIDTIEDEGDRTYFGSTNDADVLRQLHAELEAWVWDNTDKANSLKDDPYETIRGLRKRVVELEASRDGYARKALEYERLYDAERALTKKMTESARRVASNGDGSSD